MPIGYKYAERSADNYVNWAKIGTDMSKMIVDENKIREDRKEAYNQATRKALDDLANAPMGENQDLNGVMAKAARDATEYIKMQDKLFKSGRLKEMDYVHTRQNVTDGYKNLFGLTKELQTDYASKMERYRKGDSSISEADVMAMIESLGNIADSQIYINPMNGMVSVAKTKKEVINGKEVTTMDNDPSKMFAVNELRNYIKQKFDKFNLGVVDADVKAVGKKTMSILTQGTLTKIGSVLSINDPVVMSKLNTDAEKKEVTDFKKYVTDLANVRVEGNPFNAQSILRDFVGSNPVTKKPYEVKLTNKFDPAEAAKNPNVIYLQKQSNGSLMPVLSDEQKKVARDFIEERIYAGVDQEQKIQATAYRPQPQQQSEASMVREMDRKNAENVARNLVDMLTGDQFVAKNAISFFRSGNNPAYIQKRGSDITTYDKAGNPIKFEALDINDSEFVRRLVRSVNTTGLNEDDIVNKAMELMKGKTYNEDTGLQYQKDNEGRDVLRTAKIGYGYEAPETKEDIGVYYDNVMTPAKEGGESLIRKDKDVTSAESMNSAFNDKGYVFRATPKTGVGDDEIQVSADGKTWSKSFPINNDSDISIAKQKIREFMVKNKGTYVIPAP